MARGGKTTMGGRATIVGVSAQLDALSRQVGDLADEVRRLHQEICEGNGKPSHRSRLDMLERWQAGVSRAGWLIGGALGVDVALRLWALVVAR